MKTDKIFLYVILLLVWSFTVQGVMAAMDFGYTGSAEADGRKAELSFTITGTNVKGSLTAQSVCEGDIRLPRTAITFTGTVGGGLWENPGTTIVGPWTGGDFACDGNLMPAPDYPVAGTVTISIQNIGGKNIVHLQRITPSQYGYIFGATGRVYNPANDNGAWVGKWNTDWGTMTLNQTGNDVTGNYEYDSGKISGTVSGNILKGTWSEYPTYNPPRDAGDIEFTLDGDSFTGKWRYGSSGDWSGQWVGKKIISDPTPTPTPTVTPTVIPTPTPTYTTPIPTYTTPVPPYKQPGIGIITVISIIFMIYLIRKKN